MIQGRDIAVLIYLSTKQHSDWTIRSLARELEMAPAGVQRSIKNLVDGGLLFNPPSRGDKPSVIGERLGQYLVYGVRPNFPPVFLGDNVRGVRAASYAAPLRGLTTQGGEQAIPLVWPYPLGQDLGTAIQPLHDSVPRLALGNKDAGELFALVDAIRYVRAPRIQSLAGELILKSCGHNTQSDQ